MTKSWRPRNWDNPFIEEREYFNKKYGGCEGDSLYNGDIRTFEAGADAILEALKKDGVFTYGHHTPEIELEDAKEVSGYWFFIPEEQEAIISLKAGYDEGLADGGVIGRKQGVREVVEWVGNNVLFWSPGKSMDWQAKVKEWEKDAD